MSVINQMLKDLDQRQVDQQELGNMSVPITSSSNKKVLLISLIVIVVLNVLGIFIWQMYVENQTLKLTNSAGNNKNEIQVTQNLPNDIAHSTAPPPVLELKDKATTDNSSAVNKVENQQSPIVEIPANPFALPEKAVVEVASDIAVPMSVPTSVTTNISANQTQSIKPIMPEAAVNKPSLKISRKKISPDELAKQKMQSAEQALTNNEITKAEHLFEDVLLIKPEHKTARKQLAALWFGRNSYAAAINLLSQGIALSPNDHEFRMMQARIYLQTSRMDKALTTLNNMEGVNDVADVEYQSLRATIAQQLNEFSSAADAYQILANIEPSAGRWWLGLGIARDSNGELKRASVAYKTALNKIGLSDSAENFARQRVIELGE